MSYIVPCAPTNLSALTTPRPTYTSAPAVSIVGVPQPQVMQITQVTQVAPAAQVQASYQVQPLSHGAAYHQVVQRPSSFSPQLVQNASSSALASPLQPLAGSSSSLAQLMQNRTELKKNVVKCFKAVTGGRRSMDINELRQFRWKLSQLLGLPDAAFGDIDASHARFDFDGNGLLGVNNVYKLVKFNLYAYMKQTGQIPAPNIPHKSLASAGLRVSKHIGAGNQAEIYLATDTMGRDRCVKCYRKGHMQVGGMAELSDEFEALKLVACKNVAAVEEMFQDAEFYYMVGDAYRGGEFGTAKERAMQNGVNPGEDWFRGLFVQCFEALQFMHEQAMMHCDIKEANLMLKTEDYNSPQVVLIDFGVSTAMSKRDTGLTGGTPGYIPPETFETAKWYPGGDVFSMGVVMVQMLLDKVPDEKRGRPMCGIFMEGCQTLDQVRMATLTREAPIHQLPFPGIMELCRKCLVKQLQHRAKAPQALNDPWFAQRGCSSVSMPIISPTASVYSVPVTTYQVTQYW